MVSAYVTINTRYTLLLQYTHLILLTRVDWIMYLFQSNILTRKGAFTDVYYSQVVCKYNAVAGLSISEKRKKYSVPPVSKRQGTYVRVSPCKLL